jgi:hypothetical protein
LAAAALPATLRRCNPTRADSRDRPPDIRLSPRALLLLCEGRLVLVFLRNVTQAGQKTSLQKPQGGRAAARRWLWGAQRPAIVCW